MLALLGGCSALRLGYAQGPALVYWWLDRYVDFDAAQAPRVRDALARWFAWHRREQLPEYATLLAQARAEVLADTTAQRVCEWQRELAARARAAWDEAEPAAAAIAATLGGAQIRRLESRYARNNEEFRDEYLQSEPRERAVANLERTLDRAEMLYGRFDDAQRRRVAEWLARSPFDPEAWLAERRARQLDALRLLRALNADGAAAPAQAVAALRGYVERLQRSPREAYRRYNERLTEFNCAFAADVHNGTTAAQRRHAARKLAGWEDDVRALAAHAPQPQAQPQSQSQ